jgi:hypothetical protein
MIDDLFGNPGAIRTQEIILSPSNIKYQKVEKNTFFMTCKQLYEYWDSVKEMPDEKIKASELKKITNQLKIGKI